MDEDSMFLRNIGTYRRVYTATKLEEHNQFCPSPSSLLYAVWILRRHLRLEGTLDDGGRTFFQNADILPTSPHGMTNIATVSAVKTSNLENHFVF
jgi:hypothetical protein